MRMISITIANFWRKLSKEDCAELFIPGATTYRWLTDPIKFDGAFPELVVYALAPAVDLVKLGVYYGAYRFLS